MSITKKTINGAEYEFINDSYGNRSGFVHKTTLYKDGVYVGENKCQYYNRTWEQYTYQSVMKGLIYNLQCSIKESYRNSWKEKNGIKRLKKARECEMLLDLENENSYYMELKELYYML